MKKQLKVSVVIPAYNEEKAITKTIAMIKDAIKNTKSYSFEIVVSNNNSTDKTGEIAKENDAKVVFEPKQGYGNAYKKGLKSATGDIIITGDADATYPFEDIPRFLHILEKTNADFINTNRFANPEKKAFSFTHLLGNKMLTFANNIVFGTRIKDSQSGMWVFTRKFLDMIDLDLLGPGMSFSQEIKLYAIMLGLKFKEIPIKYRARVGEVKLNTIGDGFNNFKQILLFKKKLKKKLKQHKKQKQ